MESPRNPEPQQASRAGPSRSRRRLGDNRSARRRRRGGAIDPEPRRVYQLVVVGGGTAGLAAVAAAVRLGIRAALIERHRRPQNRLVSSVPSVGLVHAARSRTQPANGDVFGGRRVGDDGGDFTAAMARARELQGELAIFTDADQLCRQGVDVFFGSGRFVAADAVEVEQHRLRFRRALISTGARPVAPAVPGFEDIDFLTPETLFQLEELPAAMAILGDNAEACEMAQAFADLGSRVHLLTSAPRLLPRADATGAEAITRAVSEAGVEVITACDLVEIQPRRAHASGHLTIVTTDHAGFEVDQILVTGHSTPNVEQLGLEAAGVEYDLDGIEVDSRFRTTSRHIYAAGDVLAPVGIEHAADDEGRRAVRNAALPRLVRRRPFAVPHAAFTRPEVAWVGLDAETATMMNAKKVGAKVETLTLPLHERQAAHRPEALHLYLERRSGRILGGVLIADGATEMIAPLVLAVRRRMRLETLAQSLVPYPAKGEIYRRAALLWERDRRRPPRNLLELWLRLT